MDHALVRQGLRGVMEELIVAVGRALSAVTTEEANGWFGRCGYSIDDRLSCEKL